MLSNEMIVWILTPQDPSKRYHVMNISFIAPVRLRRFSAKSIFLQPALQSVPRRAHAPTLPITTISPKAPQLHEAVPGTRI